MAGGGQHRHHVVERLDLHCVERVVWLVGHREVRAHTGKTRGRRMLDGVGQIERLVGSGADTAHSRVDLEVNSVRVAACLGNGVQLLVRVDGQLQAGVDRVVQIARGLFAEHQDATVEPCIAQRQPLLHQGHAQTRRATPSCRGGDLGGAMAVAVGFDDCPYLRRRRDRADRLDVVADGLEVDLGPRPPAHSSSSSTAGIRSGRSLATKPCRCPRRPAWPCTHAPAAAACSGRTPLASSAPMIPLSTSPVPAVANRASPAVTTSTSPDGSATIVAAPFNSTVHAQSDASLRAATMRSSPGRAPVSSVYSPSCGVNTVGNDRRRSSVLAPSALQPKANRPSPSITIGNGASTTNFRTFAAVSSERPSPGPTTIE